MNKLPRVRQSIISEGITEPQIIRALILSYDFIWDSVELKAPMTKERREDGEAILALIWSELVKNGVKDLFNFEDLEQLTLPIIRKLGGENENNTRL